MAVVTPEVPRSFARCGLCYARVRLAVGEDSGAALYFHELSGTCGGHVAAKVKAPRRTKAEMDQAKAEKAIKQKHLGTFGSSF